MNAAAYAMMLLDMFFAHTFACAISKVAIEFIAANYAPRRFVEDTTMIFVVNATGPGQISFPPVPGAPGCGGPGAMA